MTGSGNHVVGKSGCAGCNGSVVDVNDLPTGADAGIVLLCGWSFSDKSTVAANLAGDLGKVVDGIERKAASWLATRPAAQSCGERQPLTRQGYAAIVAQ